MLSHKCDIEDERGEDYEDIPLGISPRSDRDSRKLSQNALRDRV